MQKSYRVLENEKHSKEPNGTDQFALDVLIGLSAPRKFLFSRYFYDDRGSELFTEITKQPEYYLTLCEKEVFSHYSGELGALFSESPFNLIELGAGDGQKTRVLLETLEDHNADFRYMPIDISQGAMRTLTESLESDFPKLKIEGIVSEYLSGIQWIRQHTKRRNIVLFLGSSIGNFVPETAHRFLTNLWHALKDGDLVLIGFDLKKNIDLLLAAYSDAKGVTKSFNLNLLSRLNAEFGADFNVENFRHVPNYNFQVDAMQSFLVSTKNQVVTMESLGRKFSFSEWESIHVESSFKYSKKDIEDLANRCGFEVKTGFMDSRGWFCDSLWTVRKDF